MLSLGNIRAFCATLARRKLARVLAMCTVALPVALGIRLMVHSRQHKGGRVGGANPPHAEFTPRAPELQIATVVHHGRIVEIKGSTEPGAVVMINGQPAATFFQGNSFRHFVGPLPSGTTIVTITIQNEEGGVTTRQLAVTVD